MSAMQGKVSYRDRTQEFLSVAEKLKKSFSSTNNAASSSNSNSSSSAKKPDATRSAVAIQSEFNKRASKIGFGIHQTSQKLAKLAKCEFFFSISFLRIVNCVMHAHAEQKWHFVMIAR